MSKYHVKYTCDLIDDIAPLNFTSIYLLLYLLLFHIIISMIYLFIIYLYTFIFITTRILLRYICYDKNFTSIYLLRRVFFFEFVRIQDQYAIFLVNGQNEIPLSEPLANIDVECLTGKGRIVFGHIPPFRGSSVSTSRASSATNP